MIVPHDRGHSAKAFSLRFVPVSGLQNNYTAQLCYAKFRLIHWLPKKIHRKKLSLIGLKFYSKEENLNLLSKTNLINLLNNFDTIQYEIRYINLLGLKSNYIIFGKIINSSERSK